MEEKTPEQVFDEFMGKYATLLSKLEISLFGMQQGEDGFILRTDKRLEHIEEKIVAHDKIYEQAPEVFAMVKTHDKIMDIVNLLIQKKNWRFIAGIFFVLAWLGYFSIKAFILLANLIIHR